MSLDPADLTTQQGQSPDEVVGDFLAEKGDFAKAPDRDAQKKADAVLLKEEQQRAREAEQVKAKLASEDIAAYEKEQQAQQAATKQAMALDQKNREIQAKQNATVIKAVTGAVSDRANKMHDAIVNAPMPEHGIGILLGVIIFFLWAAIPVNDQGMTRFELLFYTIMGRTTMNYPGSNPLYGGGSSGDFGNQPAPKSGGKTGGADLTSIDPGRTNYWQIYNPTDDFSPGVF